MMHIVELLIQEPRGPSRLAQAANLNYKKCDEYLAVLLGSQLVGVEVSEGHETYFATLKGKDVFLRWERIFEDLKLP